MGLVSRLVRALCERPKNSLFFSLLSGNFNDEIDSYTRQRSCRNNADFYRRAGLISTKFCLNVSCRLVPFSAEARPFVVPKNRSSEAACWPAMSDFNRSRKGHTETISHDKKPRIERRVRAASASLTLPARRGRQPGRPTKRRQKFCRRTPILMIRSTPRRNI